jgi:hypothetical protein
MRISGLVFPRISKFMSSRMAGFVCFLKYMHVLIDLFIFQVRALGLRNLDGPFVVGHD